MIVKNEAHVIQRCLQSVKHLIDTWVIVDTGSTDNTVEIIEQELQGIPGELVHRPWINFGHNRTEALQLATGRADYALVIDADEVWQQSDGYVFPTELADCVQVLHEVPGGTTFFLTKLMKLSLPWTYEGVLHEVATCKAPHSIVQLDGPRIVGMFDSARNQQSQRDKYLADAEVLAAALVDEPDNARYVFYYAQSLRDAGEIGPAVDQYLRRVELGGWAEEVWYSLYQVAILRERLGFDWPSVLADHLRAFDFRPGRAEALCEIARILRVHNLHETAYLFATRAVAIEGSQDILFLDPSAYGWRALDELALAAHFTGRHAEAIARGQQALNAADNAPAHVDRLRQNLAAYKRAASEQAN